MPAIAQRQAPPKVGEVLSRFFDVQRADMDEKERTIPLSFSSEEPVDRYWGIEVLSHDKDACDLSFLNDGAPLLVEHDRRDHVGVIESAKIEKGKGRANVRFSKSARGEEIFQDVKDQIRRKVSVSYEIIDMELTSKTDDVDTYTITRWRPLEISIVSIPADNNVGTDRSAPTDTTQTNTNMFKRSPLLDPAAGGTNGGGGAGTATAPPATPPSESRASITADEKEKIRKAEMKRASQIITLGTAHGVEAQTVQRFIDEDKPVDEFQRWILENRYKAKEIDLNPEINMSKKDLRNYSIVRALNARAQGLQLTGLEKEASDEVATRSKRPAQGFYIPHDVTARAMQEVHGLSTGQMMTSAANLQRMAEMQGRSLTASVGSAGGFSVGTNVLGSNMIELLRNATLVLQLGALHLTGLDGNIAVPKHTGGATAYWVGEDGTLTTSDQTFGQLGLTPKRVGAFTKYARQLLIQSSIDIEAFVRMDLMLVLAIAKDLACLAGTGGAQPIGILNTTGINSITFGGAATWQKVVDFETEVAKDNARMGALAYLVTAATRGRWKVIEAFSSTGVTLWDRGQNTVNGYRAEVTEQLPTNRVVYGNWRDLIVADWDGLDVVVDPYTSAEQALSRIVVNTLTDNGVRHAESFAASTDTGAA